MGNQENELENKYEFILEFWKVVKSVEISIDKISVTPDDFQEIYKKLVTFERRCKEHGSKEYYDFSKHIILGYANFIEERYKRNEKV